MFSIIYILYIPIICFHIFSIIYKSDYNQDTLIEKWFFKVKLTQLKSWVQFRHSVLSDSLWPHGLQHGRLPCPSPTPRACSNSCPSSRWCHPTLILCPPLLLLPSIFPIIWVFSNESALRIRWPKYWRPECSVVHLNVSHLSPFRPFT